MIIILLFYHSNDLLRPIKVNSNQHIKTPHPLLLIPLIKTRGYTFFMGIHYFAAKFCIPLPPVVLNTKCCRKIMHPPKDQRKGYTVYGDALFRVTASIGKQLPTFPHKVWSKV